MSRPAGPEARALAVMRDARDGLLCLQLDQPDEALRLIHRAGRRATRLADDLAAGQAGGVTEPADHPARGLIIE